MTDAAPPTPHSRTARKRRSVWPMVRTEFPMNIKYTTKWYLLRWALGFAYLGDGLAVVFTLGFCDPSFGLKVGNAFLTENERCASLS